MASDSSSSLMDAAAKLSVTDKDNVATPEKPFSFFNLARETRDAIYNYCTEPMCCTRLDSRLHYGGEDILISTPAFVAPTMLLVSSKFKEEYEEEVYRTAEITLWPRQKYRLQALVQHIPTAWCRIQSVTVTMELDPWMEKNFVTQEIEKPASGISDCVRMYLPDLRDLSINLRFNRLDYFLREPDLPHFARFFEDASLDNERAGDRNNNIRKGMHIQGQLYKVNEELVEDPFVGNALDSMIRNFVVYRAYPASDTLGWHGLELVTEETGYSDWEDVLGDAKRSRLADLDYIYESNRRYIEFYASGGIE